MAEAASFTTRELVAALDKASIDVKRRVLGRMDQAAGGLVSVLYAKYPRGKTGNLLKGVARRKATTFGFIVRSTAKHVHFVDSDKGTKERRDPTRKNAKRGRMKPNPIFVPAAVRERKSFLSDAQAILDQPRELV